MMYFRVEIVNWKVQSSLLLSIMQQILSILKSQLQDDLSAENIKEWETQLAIVRDMITLKSLR